jgi:hypothetical protein
VSGRAGAAFGRVSERLIDAIEKESRRALRTLKWRWALAGLLLIAISVYLTIPIYGYPAVHDSEIVLDVFVAGKTTPSWLGVPNIAFSDRGRSRAGLRFTFVGSAGPPQIASVRLFVPPGSTCEKHSQPVPPASLAGRRTLPQLISVEPVHDPLGKVGAAYSLRFHSTDLPVALNCTTQFAVLEPSYATRRITIARFGNGAPWPSFSKLPRIDAQLAAGAIDQLTIDTNGTREFALPELVHLPSVPAQAFARYAWSDDRAQQQANIRLWAGAALVGLGMSALLEGLRAVLDGRAPRRRKPRAEESSLSQEP